MTDPRVDVLAAVMLLIGGVAGLLFAVVLDFLLSSRRLHEARLDLHHDLLEMLVRDVYGPDSVAAKLEKKNSEGEK